MDNQRSVSLCCRHEYNTSVELIYTHNTAQREIPTNIIKNLHDSIPNRIF